MYEWTEPYEDEYIKERIEELNQAQQEARFQAWLQRYEAAASRFAVCRLLAELGPRTPQGEAAAVVAFHDRYTLSPGDLPLA